jgi:hypothetical protein
MNIDFTKEELSALVIQVGARIDSLKEKQKQEAKNENVSRVVEIETFLQPILTGYKKMTEQLYK